MFTEIAFEETRVEQEKKEENTYVSSRSPVAEALELLCQKSADSHNKNRGVK